MYNNIILNVNGDMVIYHRNTFVYRLRISRVVCTIGKYESKPDELPTKRAIQRISIVGADDAVQVG